MNFTRILISDTAPLYPPLWGGPKRIWNLYRNLPKDKFSIDYVGLDNTFEGKTKIVQVADHIKEYKVPYPPFYRKKWMPKHVKYFKDLSVDLFSYFGVRWVKEYCRLLNEIDADIFISSHPWAFPCRNKRKNEIFIYDSHNCEYALMRSITKGHALSPLINLWTKRIERKACRKSDIIFACSDKNKNEFTEMYEVKKEQIHIVPNGANIPPLPAEKDKKEAKRSLNLQGKKTALFIGAYYKPNNDAADFIINSLARDLQDITFVIAGTVKHAFPGREIPQNVIFTDRVSDEDLRQYLLAADIAINPVSSGSGVNIKMLDYFAYGLPTVSTECGCRGLDAENNKKTCISSLGGFSASIQSLIENDELCKELRKGAYNFVVSSSSWKSISKTAENVMSSFLKDKQIKKHSD